MAEEIGKCFTYIGEEEAYAGGDLIILTPREDNSEFLGYLLNSPPVMVQKARLGQGNSVVHIYTSSLKTVEIELPTPDEQSAVASVLSDMDSEITALEQKRDKTKLIKQGMMQELLTGKTRLI